jgi:DNA-binding GntR family transcriptional regulator
LTATTARPHLAKRLDPLTIKGRAYQHIRRSILDFRLPIGATLSEYQLAHEIGVSRTPVREALKRLEQEGLVRSVARRGTFVADLTLRDVVEVYEVRIQLEGLAARIAADRMEPAECAEVIAELERAEKSARQKRFARAREHDIHFHKAIVRSAGNGRLAAIVSTLEDQVHRIRQRALREPTRVPATLAEHRLILEAVRRHDQDGAELAMRRHLEAARENAIQMARAGTLL